MASSNRAHLMRHVRLYGAALFGAATWLVLERLDLPLRLPVAGIAFFGAYLASTAAMLRQITPHYLRRRAAWEDEGIVLIVVLTLLAIALSLGGLVSLLN